MSKVLLFNINLSYYRWFDPYIINHYNLINKLLKFKNIGEKYYRKYPNAQNFIDTDLVDTECKNEYMEKSKQQEQIKYSIINDISNICKSDNNNCVICSEKFKQFYIERNYHIGENIELMIEIIKKDIKV
jgi:hypothetical protein